MSKKVNFIVKGDIQTKQRPRATIQGGFAKVYTPEDTIRYENYVRSEYQRQCNDFMFEDKPLYAELIFYFKPAKEVKKLQDQEYDIACMNNKDVDNLSKIILDSLNKISYADDRNIISLNAVKKYSNNDEEYVTCEIGYVENLLTLEDAKKKRNRNKLIDRYLELSNKKKLTSIERIRLAELKEELHIVDTFQQ